MTTIGLVGIVFINLALISYTIGVWSERIQGRLKWWHLGMFYTGLVCDSIGTWAMSLMSGSMFNFNFHGITGLAAIVIMFLHAGWATIVLIDKNEALILKFHKFSLVVWVIWLIPMVTGAIFGVAN